MNLFRPGWLRRHQVPLIACLVLLASGCAHVPVPEGCPANEPGPQVVAPNNPDEMACLQFSIDATKEPGTLDGPPARDFVLDPANRYRLTTVSESVPWIDGSAPAKPDTGWTGWRAFLGKGLRHGALCPQANMYQAVCAPSGATDHCIAADGRDFRPDRNGAASCFVNDWSGHYRDNSGCVAVRLCKLSP